jgi:hypothetical protein
MVSGAAAELGPRMMRLRAPATLISDHGAEIGRVSKCDGSCDAPCPGRGWHCFYDSTGDNTMPDAAAEVSDWT